MRKILGIGLIVFIFLQGESFALDKTKFMRTEELVPGMKGIGKTVFYGDKPEEFQVEILGVLEKVWPQRDLILAKLSGGPLDKTGVISGMSGSPIYVEGRLIGALAYSWAYSKEPIALLTPIEDMLKIEGEKGKGGVILPRKEHKGKELRVLPTPLVFSGLDSRVIAEMEPFLASFELFPVQGGSRGEKTSPSKLEPGSVLGVQLVRGDVDISAMGTVTYIEGKKIFGFGHPFLFYGEVDFPLTSGYVHSLLPSRYLSFKISSSTGKPLGRIKQDRRSGIFGEIGEAPQLLPLKVRIDTPASAGRGGKRKALEYNFEIVRHRLLTPVFLRSLALNSLLVSQSELEDSTMKVRSEVYLKGYPPLIKEDIISGPLTPALLAASFGELLEELYLNPFEKVEFDKIFLKIEVEKGLRTARISGVRVDKEKVKPGEEVRVSVFLKPYGREAITKERKIVLPPSLSGNRVSLHVADAQANARWEMKAYAPSKFIPKNLSQMLDLLREEKKNSDIILTLTIPQPGLVIEGKELLSPPSSLLSVLTNSGKEKGVIDITKDTIIFKTVIPTEFVVAGEHLLTLNIEK